MKRKYDAFNFILERASGSNARIVLPEGHDSRIVEAAEYVAANNICKIIILGDKNTLASRFSKKALKNITVVDPKSVAKKREMYAYNLFQLRKDKGMTEEKALEALKDNITYAIMMLKCDDAEGVVAGAVRETADVLRPAFQIIKKLPTVSKVSSSMIIEMPENSSLGDNNLMIFADCAVNLCPTDEELADIALLSAKTAKSICAIDPRVALLSYTTKASDSINDNLVLKVKRAYHIARRRDPSLIIDGDIQADAALSQTVCDSKCSGSMLDGKANVMIFPNIESGNISYKLVQRIAGVRAIGPILQGLNKPVNDLSRGTTVEEIILNIAITVLQSKDAIKGA